MKLTATSVLLIAIVLFIRFKCKYTFKVVVGISLLPGTELTPHTPTLVCSHHLAVLIVFSP